MRRRGAVRLGHCDVVKEGRDLARVAGPWPLGSCFAHTLGVPGFTLDPVTEVKRSSAGSPSQHLPYTFLHLHHGHGVPSKIFKVLGSSDFFSLH